MTRVRVHAASRGTGPRVRRDIRASASDAQASRRCAGVRADRFEHDAAAVGVDAEATETSEPPLRSRRQKGGRYRGDYKRQHFAPWHQSGFMESEQTDASDQNIQSQGCRPHLLRGEAEQGHGRQIAAGAGMADGGIQGRNQEKQRGQRDMFKFHGI